MYNKKTRGLAEAEVAVRAVMEAAIKADWRVGVALVDDAGDLIFFAKMDGAKKLTALMAPKKAYTSAMYRRDTSTIAERHKNRNWLTAVDFSPDFTPIPAGIIIVDPEGGNVIGAIGVSGPPEVEGDVRLAQIGKKAAEDYLRQQNDDAGSRA